MKTGSTLLSVTLWLGIGVSAATATTSQTWVSGTGKDSGSCTLAAPCATFQYAMGQTSTSGTVLVLTSGSYGVLTIGKSLNIIAPAGVDAAINVPANGDGVTVNASGGTVLLRGLTIDGQNPANTYGILLQQGALTIDHVSIAGLNFAIYGTGGFMLIKSSLLNGNTGYGVYNNNKATDIYIGESTISGNKFGIGGSVNSYGDNDLNGNTSCDICEGTVTEVSHDQ